MQFGNTALHEASLNDHFEIVKLLLEHKDHKANIKLQNNVMASWLCLRISWCDGLYLGHAV